MRCKWILVGAVAALVLPAPSGGEPASRSAKQVSNAALAKRLAAEVYGARTANARYRALLAVMKAVHEEVYSARGKPISHGLLAQPKSFYLYKFQLNTIAEEIAQRRTSSLFEVAGFLARADIGSRKPGDVPTIVAKDLTTSVRWALAHQQAPQALVPLLIEQLGRRHARAFNLSRRLNPTQNALDALQRFLLINDIEAAAVEHRRGSARHPRSDSAGCTDRAGNPSGEQFSESWGAKFGDFISTKVGFPESDTSMTAGGDSLSSMFKVVPTQASYQKSHYGPAGHAVDAGKPLRFEVKILFTEAPGGLDEPVCGWLAGVNWPDPGPVAGVETQWASQVETAPTQGLNHYGSVTSSSTTNAAGASSISFIPNDEAVPGFGQLVTASGNVYLKIRWDTALPGFKGGGAGFTGAYYIGTGGGYFSGGNGGHLGQNIVYPMLVPPGGPGNRYYGVGSKPNWDVSRHAPRGFEFANMEGDFTQTLTDALGGNLVYQWRDIWSGYVCGENPFTVPWDMHADGYWTELTYPQSGELHDDFPAPVFVEGDPLAQSSPSFSLILQPPLHPNPRMSFLYAPTSRPPGDVWDPAQLTLTAPVTEDMSCQAPTP